MTPTVMVQITNSTHRLDVMHLACALARSKDSQIALVRMVPVLHPGWLGTEWGYADLSDNDFQIMDEYRSVAEEYGVKVEVHAFQYSTLFEGIIQAAGYVNAEIVFAALPESRFAWWHKWQVRRLERRLAEDHCLLYLPGEQGDAARWTPSILVPTARVSSR